MPPYLLPDVVLARVPAAVHEAARTLLLMKEGQYVRFTSYWLNPEGLVGFRAVGFRARAYIMTFCT